LELNSNLTNDGRWLLTWDGENRLVKLESQATAPTASKLKLEFVYDAQGRRLEKTVSTNNGTLYVGQSTNCFGYDGWNVLAVLSPSLSAGLQYFYWGPDLSGQAPLLGGVGGGLQGAGGVGGLLWARFGPAPQFVAYDGNGNVAALVHGTTGAVTAQYEYGPFGELLRATGTWAKSNPFRFSTKYQDDESDLLYYGYRYYNPGTGRWPNRDPIGERGGWNLYGFVGNQPITRIDLLGNAPCGCGLDVTAALNRTLGWIDAAYATWSLSEKRSACNALYDVTNPKQLINAWDMLYLADIGFNQDPTPCARTVTFSGKCYYGGAANYAMWGRINKLCWSSFGWIPKTPTSLPGINDKWSLPYALAAVVTFKVGYYHQFGEEEAQALAFTVYGYTGALPSAGLKNCKPNSKSVRNYAFQWRWWPVRHPDGEPPR
jgi:RHS repeat-associated protein